MGWRIACLLMLCSTLAQAQWQLKTPFRVTPGQPSEIQVILPADLEPGPFRIRIHREACSPLESEAREHTRSEWTRQYAVDPAPSPNGLQTLFEEPQSRTWTGSYYWRRQDARDWFRFPFLEPEYSRELPSTDEEFIHLEMIQPPRLKLDPRFTFLKETEVCATTRDSKPFQIQSNSIRTWSIPVDPLEPGYYVIEVLLGSRAGYLPCRVSSLVLTGHALNGRIHLKVLDTARGCLARDIEWMIPGKDGTWKPIHRRCDGDGNYTWEAKDFQEVTAVVARRSGDMTGTWIDRNTWCGQGQAIETHPSLFAYTDRPVYRPGQEVFLRAILSAPRGEALDLKANTRSPFWVLAPENRHRETPKEIPLEQRGIPLRLSGPDWGSRDNDPVGTAMLLDPATRSFAGSLRIPRDAKPGEYHVRVDAGQADLSIPLEVQHYEKPRFKVSFQEAPADSGIKVLRLGLKAEALHGGPVPEGRVEWFLYQLCPSSETPWLEPSERLQLARSGEGTTDAKGTFVIEIPEEVYRPDRSYRLLAKVTDAGGQRQSALRELGKASSSLTDFQVEPSRYVLRPGERFEVSSSLKDLDGMPLEAPVDLRIALAQRGVIQQSADGQNPEPAPWYSEVPWRAERTVAEGRGPKASFSLEAGAHVLVASATLPSGERLERLTPLLVVDDTTALPPTPNLRAVVDPARRRVGDKARILVLLPRPRMALQWEMVGTKIAGEGFRRLTSTTALLELTLPGDFDPNGWVHLLAFDAQGVERMSLGIHTLLQTRDLGIQVSSDRTDYRPGEAMQLRIAPRDARGRKPLTAVSVAVVDEALFSLAPEYLGNPMLAVNPLRGDPTSFLHSLNMEISGELQDNLLRRASKLRPIPPPPPPQMKTSIELDPEAGKRAATTGSIAGIVLDEQGQPIQGAKILLESVSIFQPRICITDSKGAFRALLLPEGDYTLKLSAPRKVSQIVTNVRVARAFTLRYEFKLYRAPHPEEATVEVVAEMACQSKSDDKVAVNYSAAMAPASALSEQDLSDRAMKALRDHFLDTALWIPHLDVKGSTTVKVPLPEDLTRWRATVVGVTADGCAGVGRHTVNVNKPLQVNLIVPSVLTSGDETRALIVLQNRSQQMQKGRVKLEAPGMILPDGAELPFELAASEERRIPLRLEAGSLTGSQEIRAGAASASEQDGEKRPIEVKGPAVEYRIQGSHLLLGDSQRFTLKLPPEATSAGAAQFFAVSGGLEQVMQPSLQYLLRYPYGCAEQTLSSFYPNILVADLVKRGLMPPLPDKSFEDLDLYIRTGVERIYGYQLKEGGWGWYSPADFGGRASAHTTGYAVMALSGMKRLGYPVEEERLEKGLQAAKGLLAEALQQAQRPVDPKDPNTRWPVSAGQHDAAFLLTCLAKAGTSQAGPLDQAVQGILGGTWAGDTLLAQVALAAALGKHPRTNELLDRLEQRAIRDDGLVCWRSRDEDQNSYHSGDTFATLTALHALALGRPTSTLLAGGEAFLVTRFEGCGWNSTWITSQVVALLPELAKIRPIAWEGVPIRLRVAGSATKDLATGAEPFSVPLTPGQGLEVEASGRGVLVCILNSATSQAMKSPTQSKLRMEMRRRLWKLESPKGPEGFTKRAWDGQMQLGEEAYLEVEVSASQSSSYGLVEVPVPAGFEAIPSLEDFLLEGKDMSALQGHVRSEIYGDRVAFLLDWLGQEPRTLRLRLRAKLEGRYQMRPVKLSLMSDESQWCTTDSDHVTISERGSK